MCERTKPKMLDKKMRGSHDLEVRIYDLMKQNDLNRGNTKTKHNY